MSHGQQRILLQRVAASCHFNLMRGFNLIELMIVIVLVILLSAFSIATYQSQTIKSYRNEAKNMLMMLAGEMEKHESNFFVYEDLITADAFPAQVKSSGSDPLYDLKIEIDGSSYTLSATPVDGSRMANDGTLTLNHLGEKTHGNHSGW